MSQLNSQPLFLGHMASMARPVVNLFRHKQRVFDTCCDSPPKVELSFEAKDSIQCNNLRLVLVLLNGATEVGRKEVLLGSSEFSWPGNIPVEHRLGARQSLTIRVHSVDKAFCGRPVEKLLLGDQTLLAEGSCMLHQIVTANDQEYTFPLQNKHPRCQIGKLTVTAKETVESSFISLDVKYCPANPTRKRERGIEGRYLQLSKVVNGEHNVIHTTEVVKEILNPKWSIPLTSQQIGSEDGKLVLKGYNSRSNGKRENFRKWAVLVSDLDNGNAKVTKGLSVRMSKSYAFLEYFSNYKLGFMVAVKFSATNGSPTLSSLPVIKNVGKGIECYNSDRHVSAWGFGGKTSLSQEQSSCFNLNQENPDNCEVNNVEGVIEALQSAVEKVKLDCKDYASLSEIIKEAMDFVDNSVSSNYRKYYVFLIIMDGDWFNVQKVIDSLVDASKRPMSIRIVGMGDGCGGTSFNDLKERCANNGHPLVNSKGDRAQRDLVLCMPYSELPADEQGMAETLLNGVRKEYCAYMLKNGIKPC